MIISNLKSVIAKIADSNPDGFTYNPIAGRFCKRGYVVASDKTQDCFGKKGLQKVIRFCFHNPDYAIGGWRNEDGIMQYDASKVFLNINDAIVTAIANKQRAIFDLYNHQEIMASEYTDIISMVA